MAIRSLPSNYGYKNNNNRYSVLNKPVGTTYLPSTYSQKEEEKEQNVGGLLGGIGYLGEKVMVGTVSSIEGIVDYLGSGFAKLFGNDQWAEQIISEDWFGDWYSHPEEWFNPDKGWQVAGDVAGGVGTSLPALAATLGAAAATGGASLAVQGAATFGASFLTSGLGAAGRSTKEAYEESGELTGKEFGYGALSGATEGGLEGVTNLLGMGTGAIVKSITKSLAKETGEALLKNVAVEGLKSFAGEAFEEGVSEWITPYWKRATYDPNAKEATSDEIMYSALVGGLSGLVMDGGRFAYDKSASYISGVRAAKSGTEAQILNEANDIAAFENENQTEEELFTEIIRIRDKLTKSLEATGGKATRVDQQMELGSLRRAVVAAASEIGVAKRAFNIVNNAELISNRLTAYGYKKADGAQITYTADQLTAGYDKTRPQSIYKALKTNDTLRNLAVADFTGRLMMDTNKFKQATLTGQRLASQVDLNRFLQQANPEEVAAVSEALGITSWSGLTAEQFNQKITDFLTNGGVQKTLQANELKGAFKAIPAEGAQGVPRIVNLNKDGIRRYTDGKLDIGVERKGDSYTVYDYNADTLSKGLDREGVNSVFRDYAKRNAEVGVQNAESVQETIPQAEPTGNQKYQSLVEDIKKFQSEVREVDSFAREHVKEYAKLSQPSKDMVKNVILQGRKQGISDSDLTMYARVSAHSGIDIQFDKEATYRGTKEDGSADYADGFYEAAKNRIVVNPEGKRGAERLLIHELDHAIRKYFDSEGKPATRIYLEAIEGVDQATRDKITKKYKKTAKPGEAAATIMDETNAYYAEQVLGNKYTLEKLIEAEPTLKDKILSFFKGASTDYADVPKLSGAAKKYYRTYKKLFDEFSARNAQSNANETVTSAKSDKQYAFAGANAKTADKMKLATAEKMLKDGADSETVRKETGWFKGYDGKWRFEIDDSDSRLIENPALQKHEDDGEVYFTGKLSDIFNHKELFASYPDLEDINIVIQKTDPGVDAVYQPNSNYITLSLEQFKRHTRAYHDYLDGGRRAEIKRIEESEAYKEYNRLYDDDVVDSMDPQEWLEAEKAAREKFYSSELGKRYYKLMWGKDGFTGDKFEFGWSKAAKETLLHELQHAIQKREGFASGTNTRDANYDRNAGEIEARDVAKRADLSVEQRKNTRPDVDRTNVVVRGSSNESFAYIGDTKDGRRCYTSGFDKNLSMDERIDLFKKRVATIFNLGAVELKTDVKKIRIRGDRFTAQKNLFGDKEGEKGEYEAKVNSLYDLADILATATYDPTATNKEPSYINPNVKPKNAAHKSVKYWYKFKNKIVFDGIPYEVTFNIRDKGKEQYQYLIDFKEDKTPGLSNTAVNNLLRADQASYMSSISQPNKKSNTSTKKSSKQYALDIEAVDREYSSAVERGDMEAAQRMVDEAAKKAGYDSPKLYHGTAAFGFTKFNPELADDGISIFTSNDSLVAETYSGPTRNRNISDRATITPEALESYSAEKLLSLLKKHFSNDYRIVTNAEKQDIVKAIREPLIKTARAVENFYAINMYMFNEKKRESLFAVSKAIKDVANAENYTALSDSHYEYEKVLWDLKWLDESLSDEILKIIGNSESIAFRELSTWLDIDVFHADAEYTKENGTPWMNRNEAISVLYPKIFSGVYNLYAKTANNLEIDAEGSYWSKIDGRKIGISRELKTRDIAKYAKDKGYNSVVIRNLFDNGSGSYGGMSDVYIFFGSNMLKSADPVTYDDNGKVIPLSERFNERNPDIRYALDIDSEGENISGAEVMSWLNKKPKNDGTLNLEETVARGLPYKRGKSSLTVGEIRKVIANTTHEKVYSKGEALKVVNKLSGTWGLTARARDEIADTVWQFLNEAPDVEYRQDMAHDIAEYIVAKVLMDSKTENPDALEAAERLAHLRTGIGKLSFSDEDIAELRHAVDEKGLKRLMGRWGFKGTKKAEGVSGGYVASRRIPMDVFVTNVAREMPGMDHLEEMHPAEAFLEIDKAYSRAYADSKDKWISQYWDMPDSEIPSMVKDVENGIMSAFEFMGEKSKFKKLLDERIERYEKRAERFKAERDEIKGRDRILGLLMNQASKMKNLKMGTYANATQHDSDVLRGSVERLARIQFRGNLNVSGTRQIISELRLWYNPKNSMLEYVDEQNPGYYSRGISDMLDALADGEGGFDKTDLMMLYDVMAYFTNFVENYGKVWRKGQWVDADVEAKRYVNTLQSNSELKVSVVNKLIGSKYMQTFGDPMTVARRMDMHESGFFTEMLEELREGAMGAQVAEMEILSDYDKFLTENRKYIEKTATERILYQGVEVPKMHLIGVYMTLKRKHSRPGLAQNGFAFFDTDGKKVRVNGFALDVKDITEAEIDRRSEEQIALIDSKLTDTDRQYIKILEKAYNEDARRLKAERDIQRLGFTNAGMGYYYPIRRGNIAKNVDSSEYMAELDRVSNSSFNKNTVKGARQELYIENADAVFRRHIKAVTKYSYLSPAIEAYNKLYNLDIGGNPNHPISVATESANTWDKGNEYFKKLIADIQGIPAVSGEGAEILSKIRGGYAKYQLGANPKVWFTQLSSLFASTSRLDPDSIVKAAGVSAEGLDKYCPLAKLRNSENTAAIAQAVLDTRAKRAASGISRISDALMAPIGKMDRFVVGRLFAACQVQVEKDGGAKVGTEQNKIAAGELLTQVILETQQNSIATERSAAMRSGNELLKTATMFSADSMKVTGRVLDKFGESLTLKARIKAETDADKVKALTERLDTVNKQFGKSMGAMVGSAVYMACVAQLFRHIYNKDKDEDKTTAEIMMADVMGNMIGGLPLFRDAYTKLVEGYDVSNYTYSAINDILDSVSNLANIAGDIFNGEAGAEEKNRAIRNLINSLGQISGLPTRNAYNVIFGLTKRFSPTTAFAIDSLFYKKNYQTELNKAIERGDNKMASYILGLMMGERLDENMDQSVFNELLALTKAGYKVLPKAMPDSVKLGDVEYLVSDGERATMQKIYAGYDDAVAKLIASKAYGSFTDEEKALAIDYVSDLYYSKAKSEVLGTDEKKAAKLIEALGADTIAAYYVKTREITSDLDAEGNTISGSKRAKVVEAISGLGVSVEQRLLLICASGYSLKDGDIRGVTAEAAKTRLLKYILRIRGLTADERLEIAEMCGFETKNGKIVNNFSKKLQKISKK